jgi:type II secretory pathway component PulM
MVWDFKPRTESPAVTGAVWAGIAVVTVLLWLMIWNPDERRKGQ